MYFLGEEGGYRYQERLWRLRREGTLALAELTEAEIDRMDTLMRQYQEMAADEAREAEALEWAEATVEDVAHAAR